MTPALLSKIAERLYPKRFAFALASVAGATALFGIAQFAPGTLRFVIPVAGPLVFLPWMLMCACTWFHPERGNLRPKVGGRLTVLAREITRWYVAIFTAFGVLMAGVMWPVFAVLWL